MLSSPQFKRGKKVETFLDEYFRFYGWQVEPTTQHEERKLHLGDRRLTKDGRTYLVEYKSGLQTYYTGNVFLETISVDTGHVPGWAYTCQADFIFYAALHNDEILVFRPGKLRSVIEELKLKFREVPTSNHQNKGYNTHGVIVPLEYAERHLAEKVIQI